MQQNRKEQRVNSPSISLSRDENEFVFSLLGARCQVRLQSKCIETI